MRKHKTMNLVFTGKSVVQILIYFLLFSGCVKSSDNTDAYIVIPPDPEAKEQPVPVLKGMCLFAGQAETFTDADWQAIADSPVTDFIIIPKEAAHYGASETGYKTNLAPFMVNVITQIVSRKSSAKIWIGTPGISSLNYTIAGSSLDPIYNYLSHVRDQIGASVWKKNIGGVYMNQEAVYGAIDYNDIYQNPCVKLMSGLSDRVRTFLKTKFLWIPYYGYGNNAADIIKKIGYVANKTDIFDYVVIQPHYYFDETVPENLTGVRHCVSKQTICYRDGIAVTEKTSKTIIGPEMELSWKVVPPNNYADCVARYNEYVAAFSEFKNTKPIIFYWDGTLQNALNHRINPFFQ